MAPFVMFNLVGPSVVVSVNISPREEYGNSARSGVRGLSEHRADDPEEKQVDHLNLASAGENARDLVEDAAPVTRDLCLGMAVGISPAQLVTFAASFREVAPVARLVVFFEAPTSDRFKDIIDKFDIIPLPIDRERLEPAVLRRYHPSSVRWILFQRFLDIKGSDYERVLMVDAGQTFFQGNPFDIIGEPGIYAFTDTQLIGDRQDHSTNIQNCLGSAALTKLADKPAIHSTVSLGTSSFAVEHARQMSQGLVSTAFQACETAGVSAGLNDYLLYGEETQGVQKFDQASGPVTDIQVGKYDISASRVVNPSGRLVPIVYRYVGNAALKAVVFKRYIYWVEEGVADGGPGKTTDSHAKEMAPVALPATGMDQKKVALAAYPTTVEKCAQFSVLEGFDLFKAICDLGHRRTRSLVDCCASCNSDRACQAFSFDKVNGICYMKNCDTANAPGSSTALRSVTSGIKSKKMAG
eukprot:g17589.t1